MGHAMQSSVGHMQSSMERVNIEQDGSCHAKQYGSYHAEQYGEG